MFLTRYFLLAELMVEHVYSNIQFGLIMSFSGVSFIVCAIVVSTCMYFNPTRVPNVDDGKFAA